MTMCAFALSAASLHAATVLIDGQVVESATVEIRTGGGISPEDVAGPAPAPPQGAIVVPRGVILQPQINWGAPGARRVVDVPDGMVLVFPFRTTGNPGDSGSVGISEVVGYELVARRLWISEAPGGDALEQRCSAEGVSAQNVKWAQTENRLRCSLEPRQSYYLNIASTNGCPRSCKAYLSFLR